MMKTNMKNHLFFLSLCIFCLLPHLTSADNANAEGGCLTFVSSTECVNGTIWETQTTVCAAPTETIGIMVELFISIGDDPKGKLGDPLDKSSPIYKKKIVGAKTVESVITNIPCDPEQPEGCKP